MLLRCQKQMKNHTETASKLASKSFISDIKNHVRDERKMPCKETVQGDRNKAVFKQHHCCAVTTRNTAADAFLKPANRDIFIVTRNHPKMTCKDVAAFNAIKPQKPNVYGLKTISF